MARTEVLRSVHVKPSNVVPPPSLKVGCEGPDVPATVTCWMWKAGSVICWPTGYAVFMVQEARGQGGSVSPPQCPPSCHVTRLSTVVPPLVSRAGGRGGEAKLPEVPGFAPSWT